MVGLPSQVRAMISFIVSTLLCVILVVKAETILEEPTNTHCGNIFTDKQFVLTSENYPLPYRPDNECFYLLKGGSCTTHFNIEYQDFDLASSVGCVKDRLEIGSQDALCGIKTGSKVYISEKGSLKLKFLSDNAQGKSNRRFRLLVTRIDDCERDNSTTDNDFTGDNKIIPEDTTEHVQFEWTTEMHPVTPGPNTYLPPAQAIQSCCETNVFSSKTFLLMSPNFPYSTNKPVECAYVIRKASSLVCRLRIRVLFFTLGPPAPAANACPYGHLEIDGKYICGCNSGQQFTTNFYEMESKILKFRSAGFILREPSGFVLEVIQDECQKSYFPEKSTKKFRYYNDQFNRVKWPYSSNINQLRLVNEKSSQDNKLSENVYKHFYFFAPVEEKDTSWNQGSREYEETNNIEISKINNMLPTNLYNYQQCMRWNADQLISLKKKYGDSLKETCKNYQSPLKDESDCMEFTSLTGILMSPGYPIGYPAGRNFCYRWKLFPGYCDIKLTFRDFQIEKSYDCLKDYLAISQFRYCGNYLADKQVTISSNGKLYQDLKFVSDSNNCGKGFSAMYQQIRCQKPDINSITPVNCVPGGKAADENPISCAKVITDKYFMIRGHDEANYCTYDIVKYSEDICKVQLSFDHFNLPCGVGSLTVDGRVFCGEISEEPINIDIESTITIIYKQSSAYRFSRNIGFFIRGEQLECESFTPGAVRLASSLPKKMASDVCALISNNVDTKELPLKICENLIKYHKAIECNFTKAEILNFPDATKNVRRVRLLNELSEKLSYQEIECPII